MLQVVSGVTKVNIQGIRLFHVTWTDTISPQVRYETGTESLPCTSVQGNLTALSCVIPKNLPHFDKNRLIMVTPSGESEVGVISTVLADVRTAEGSLGIC